MKGLKQKRLEKNLTQSKLAELLNLSLNTIYHYENGKRFPNRKMLEKLAAFFDCTINELM